MDNWFGSMASINSRMANCSVILDNLTWAAKSSRTERCSVAICSNTIAKSCGVGVLINGVSTTLCHQIVDSSKLKTKKGSLVLQKRRQQSKRQRTQVLSRSVALSPSHLRMALCQNISSFRLLKVNS